MSFFRRNITSDEYTKLFSLYEALRIRFETLEIELALYKKKLRVRAGIEEEERKENKTKDPYQGVLLPE